MKLQSRYNPFTKKTWASFSSIGKSWTNKDIIIGRGNTADISVLKTMLFLMVDRIGRMLRRNFFFLLFLYGLDFESFFHQLTLMPLTYFN
jgi:hypothetical protein